jgi:hypothetical protein
MGQMPNQAKGKPLGAAIRNIEIGDFRRGRAE